MGIYREFFRLADSRGIVYLAIGRYIRRGVQDIGAKEKKYTFELRGAWRVGDIWGNTTW
ncbi:hypothetical protein [Thermococcus sp.]|uniref:hypothetical protein n=1 Tax=Thermococcus sp. TaxID=35749 RepID=UPI00262181F9|nr:hypothetical protein [Thermococcus sp.]